MVLLLFLFFCCCCCLLLYFILFCLSNFRVTNLTNGIRLNRLCLSVLFGSFDSFAVIRTPFCKRSHTLEMSAECDADSWVRSIRACVCCWCIAWYLLWFGLYTMIDSSQKQTYTHLLEKDYDRFLIIEKWCRTSSEEIDQRTCLIAICSTVSSNRVRYRSNPFLNHKAYDHEWFLRIAVKLLSYQYRLLYGAECSGLCSV